MVRVRVGIGVVVRFGVGVEVSIRFSVEVEVRIRVYFGDVGMLEVRWCSTY